MIHFHFSIFCLNAQCIFSLFPGILLLKKEGNSAMKEETCILCRRPAALGLHIMGCLICFSCEKKLVHGAVPPLRRRRLMKLYLGFPPAPLPRKPLGLVVHP